MERFFRRYASSARTFSGAPSGALKKFGVSLRPNFLAKIPREAEAPAELSLARRGGCPDLPENKKRSTTEGKSALGSTSFRH